MKKQKQELGIPEACNNVELARIDLGIVVEAIEQYVDHPKRYRLAYLRACLEGLLKIEDHLDEITFRMRNPK